MSVLTDALAEGVIRFHMRVGIQPTVNQPSPDFSGPGVGALQTIANVVFAIVLVLAVIGGLVCTACIVVGYRGANGQLQKAGIVGVLWCVAGVAVAGSIAGLVNFGMSLKVA